jgi:hypothetical protein
MARTFAVALWALAATSLAAQSLTIVRPREIDDVLTNPGIGFTTLNRFNGDPLNAGTKWTEGYPIENYPFSGKLDVAGQPMTTVAYLRIYWKFIEPESGRYDWPMLDGVLRKARERGQTLMLRIAPYGTGPDNDVPDWFRKLAGDESAKKMRTKWRTDPEEPLYVRHFTKMIRELGRRYDGHPDLELVDVSIVGAWGEGEGTEQLSDPTLRALTDAYLDAFPRTNMALQPTGPRAVSYALGKRPFGWRVDCLGDMRCSETVRWCHMFDLYPQAVATFGIQDAWKTGPVAFEACWVMQHWKNQGWDRKYIIEQSLKWHISTFNNKSSAVPEEWRPEVDRWLKQMGYRFVLRRFSYPSTVTPQGKLAFTTWWENKGVAPCYRRFPLALRLRGENRTEVMVTGADVRSWLPGDVAYDDAIFVPADMPAGDYRIGVALLGLDGKTPKVRLAIDGVGADGWYELGKVTVRAR